MMVHFCRNLHFIKMAMQSFLSQPYTQYELNVCHQNIAQMKVLLLSWCERSIFRGFQETTLKKEITHWHRCNQPLSALYTFQQSDMVPSGTVNIVHVVHIGGKVVFRRFLWSDQSGCLPTQSPCVSLIYTLAYRYFTLAMRKQGLYDHYCVKIGISDDMICPKPNIKYNPQNSFCSV